MKQKFFTLVFILLIGIIYLVSAFVLAQQSIRLDEAQSIWASTKTIPGILAYISQDVHVPLYPLLLHFWMQVFGTDIVIVRTLSMLFFLITLPVLYVLAKETSNKKVALLSITLFSFSPFIMWYSSEARMYTLFTFVTSLNHLYFLRFIRSKGYSAKLGYFLSTVLGLYTHYFFLFLITTQTIFLFGKVGQRTIKSHERATVSLRYSLKHNAFLLKEYFALLCASIIIFAPWILYVLKQGAAGNTQPLIPAPSSFNILQSFVLFIFGFQSQGFESLLVSLWPLAVVLLFFVFTRRKALPVQNISYFVVATFVPIALVFIVSFFRPIYLTRYLILVTPTLFFLIAWLLMTYAKKISSLTIVGSLVLLTVLLLYQNISTATPVKEDYRGVTKFLNQNANAEDIVTVSAPFTVYPMEYYYSADARLTTIPEWNRYQEGAIPPYNQKQLRERLQQYAKQYNRIFLVLSYDQGYQKDIINYFDNNYKRLLYKNYSPNLQIRVYQLRYPLSTADVDT